MKGFDEEFALLKTVRADLSVKRKIIDAKNKLADLREAMLARAYSNMRFAYVN